MSENNDLIVPVLTDLSVSDSPAKEIVQYAGYMIRAAKDDRLALVLCTHQDTGELVTVLCGMEQVAEGRVSYIPYAMLFGEGAEPWTNFVPPSCASVEAAA